ncbi:Ubiquitin carboxyl-terminal hydrolase [Quillaja saponaria]|uniref:Ubiquitin carboxyl-terminal hydrolase n=1 Tax=Quillaja saponaria TaxID=32244 RepID=A0AAD7QBB9_QUISA|nr:Ubiquitin carboxyl-terminal hydrolase [Quillaja saponaria]
MMPAYGVIGPLIVMFCLANAAHFNEASFAHEVNGSAVPVMESGQEMQMVPIMEAGKMMMMNESRRRLGSFQICGVCTCCGGAKGLCLPSPCCFAINCNIPNRPFGFCSFTPRTYCNMEGILIINI